MSVTVENGKGRKGLVVDLNVVPFIDFLSCLIAFLMLGAVWAQIAAIEVDQEVGHDIDELAGPTLPPLTVHLGASGAWVARDPTSGVTVLSRAAGELGRSATPAPDWKAVRALVAADRALFPEEQRVVIDTDDGTPYEQVVAAMDLTRELGYEQTLLAGGAPVQ